MGSFRRTSTMLLLATATWMLACSDDNSSPTASTAGTAGAGGTGATGGASGESGSAGQAGTSGSAGTAGTAGSAGTAGAAGTGGNAGTGGTAGAGGTAGDGNDTPETAQVLPRDQFVEGVFAPLGQDTDWYKFDGQAGEFVVIFAESSVDTSNAAVIRMEVHQPDGTLWASSHSSNVFVNQEITTRLPATGEYRLRISADCANEPTASVCVQSATELAYRVVLAPIGVVSMAINPFLTTDVANEPDTTTPTEIHWPNNSDLGTGFHFLAGAFSSADDVDIARFTVPNDLPQGAGSVMAGFRVRRGGPQGSGATCEIGEIRVVDDATQEVLMRRVIDWSADARSSDFSVVPVERGSTYHFEIRHDGTPSETDDFYVFETALELYWAPEPVAEEATNDDPSTPTIFTKASIDDSYAFTVAWSGLLSNQGDVDHYLFAPPAIAGTPSLYCWAQATGSPVRGLKYSVLDPTTFATKAEVAAPDTTADEPFMNNVPFVPGETMLIQVTSTLPLDPGATLPFYVCQFDLIY